MEANGTYWILRTRCLAFLGCRTSLSNTVTLRSALTFCVCQRTPFSARHMFSRSSVLLIGVWWSLDMRERVFMIRPISQSLHICARNGLHHAKALGECNYFRCLVKASAPVILHWLVWSSLSSKSLLPVQNKSTAANLSSQHFKPLLFFPNFGIVSNQSNLY